ncbi:hypothetical protein [Roseobacter sp. HKCCA0434]|uniref:hypothetical protein n=1 Tax=Roseobacter sp. HKCCA0434 TaxID=3079297 RepID=UPI002905D9B9|nr:hypothetical protein [Roseobacter sp. HKCCA0434]
MKWVLLTVGGVLGVIAAASPHLLLVRTPSVPVGLYIRSSESGATYVTFCLPELPPGIRAPAHLCQPGNPDGRPVIKQIERRVGEGYVLVGQGEYPLDSSVLGPVAHAHIVGFYRPLIVIKTFLYPW